MLENVLESFVDSLFTFITSKTNAGQSGIIRKHSEALTQLGDFSFPAELKPWVSYLSQGESSDDTRLQELFKTRCQSDLVQQSANWCLKIRSTSTVGKSHRIHMFLERAVAAKVAIIQSSKNTEIVKIHLPKKRIKVLKDTSERTVDSLTSLRVEVISGVIEKLSALCQPDVETVPEVVVTWRSCSVADGRYVVRCGAVLNVNTGLKETTLSAQDYIEKRQSEMTLIAQHKYGVRSSVGERWPGLMRQLGEAAAAYELLQVRPANPVKINFDYPDTGCSKGAAFVLYNCARLQTLVTTFQQRVDSGQYPPLPDVDHTDFTLLTDEDEWSLLFNYVLGFPGLLHSCLRLDGAACVASPHLLCSFLSALVRTFSQYYRRVRILTEARAHLMPVLFARLRLLIALNQTLQACLEILNIPAVSHM